VPERAGRLSPQQWAAAQAVAAGARHLSENEAAFSRLELIRASLSLGGPAKVADVEARIATLAARGLLIIDADGQMVTTEAAVTLGKAGAFASRRRQGQEPTVARKERRARSPENGAGTGSSASVPQAGGRGSIDPVIGGPVRWRPGRPALANRPCCCRWRELRRCRGTK
jgi:hypothetical protein